MESKDLCYPGGMYQAHSTNEYTKIKDLYDGAELIHTLIEL